MRGNLASKHHEILKAFPTTPRLPDFIALLRPFQQRFFRFGGLMILNVFHQTRQHLQPVGVSFELFVVQRFDFVLSNKLIEKGWCWQRFNISYRKFINNGSGAPAMLQCHICAINMELRSAILKIAKQLKRTNSPAKSE